MQIRRRRRLMKPFPKMSHTTLSPTLRCLLLLLMLVFRTCRRPRARDDWSRARHRCRLRVLDSTRLASPRPRHRTNNPRIIPNMPMVVIIRAHHRQQDIVATATASLRSIRRRGQWSRAAYVPDKGPQARQCAPGYLGEQSFLLTIMVIVPDLFVWVVATTAAARRAGAGVEGLGDFAAAAARATAPAGPKFGDP